MWKCLKRTISEQESHQIWSFLKRNKSEQTSHQMWKFLKRKITEKKPHHIWWFLKRTNLKRFHHIKCESFWTGTFLERNHIILSYMIVLGKGKKLFKKISCFNKRKNKAFQENACNRTNEQNIFKKYTYNALQFLWYIVLTFLNSRSFFISCFAAWDMPCRYVDMSMCRYVDMIRCGDSHCSESQAPGRHFFHRNLLAVLRWIRKGTRLELQSSS